MAKAKRRTRPKRLTTSTNTNGAMPAVTDSGDWVSPSLLISELLRTRFYRRPDQQELVSKAIQTAGMCTRLIARNCASQPIRMFRKGGKATAYESRGIGKMRQKRLARVERSGTKAALYADRGGDVAEILDHPALTLMSRPNPWDVGQDFWLFHYAVMPLTGNSYHLAVTKGQNDRVPLMLLPLYPHAVNIMPSEDGLVHSYVYGRQTARQEEYGRDLVDHYKYMPAYDEPLYGQGWLRDVVPEADVIAAAIQYELNFQLNNQRPDMAVSLPEGTTAPVIEQVRALYKKVHRGPNRSGEPFIAPGIKLEPIQWPGRDSQQDERYKTINETILGAAGVPKNLVMGQDGQINIGGASINFAAQTQFLVQTIRPMLIQASESFTERLLYDRFGYEPGEVWFCYDDPVPDNRAAIVDECDKLVRNGTYTINDARAMLGEEPSDDENADKHLVNGQPAGERPPSMMDLAGADKPKDEPKIPAKPDKAEDPVKDKAVEPVSLVLQSQAWAKMGSWKTTKADVPASPMVSNVETMMREALEPWFKDYAASLIAQVENGEIPGVIVPKAMLEKFVEVTAPPMGRGMLIGWNAGVAQMGADAGAASIAEELAAPVVQQLRGHCLALGEGVTETVNAQVINTLSEAYTVGATRTERVEAVRATLGGNATGYMADRVARTETSRAVNLGRIEAMKESGTVSGVRWLLSGNPCPFCSSMDGKETPLGVPFFRRGETMTVGGKSMRLDYSDTMGPPLHPQCSCAITPVYMEAP